MKKYLPHVLIALCALVLLFVAVRLIADKPAAAPAPTATSEVAADPAATQAPDAQADPAATVPPMATIATPVRFDEYQQHLQALVESQIPDTQITWEQDASNSSMWLAVSQGNLTGIVCTVEGEYVDEVMFLVMGDMSEDMLQVFMGMSAYAVGALGTINGMEPEIALASSINSVSLELQNVVNGTPTYEFGGHPFYMLISQEDESTFAMQMVLDLIPEAAATEAPAAE